MVRSNNNNNNNNNICFTVTLRQMKLMQVIKMTTERLNQLRNSSKLHYKNEGKKIIYTCSMDTQNEKSTNFRT